MSKHNRKGFSLVELLLVLFLILALAFGGYYVWHNQQKSKPSATDSSEAAQIDDVVSQVKSLVASKYDNLTLSSEAGGNLLLFKMPGYDFAATTQTASAQTASYKTKNNDSIMEYPTAIETDVKGVFTKAGYSLDASQPAAIDQVSENVGQKNMYFQKGKAICELDISTSSLPLSVKCSTLAAITKSAVEEKPFYDALVAGGNPSNAIGIPVIKDSQTAGYRTASVGVGSIDELGGAAAQFYSKNNGSWIYFTAGQMSPSCDQYDSIDLKAAFKGLTCINPVTGDQQTI